METPTTAKKVLYVITKSNFGGAQRYVYELATALQYEGHIVAVASGGTGELTDRLSAAGIQTFRVNGLGRDVQALEDFKALFSLISIMRSYKPDVVHLNSGKAGALGALVARLLRVPKIVFTAHGWSFLEPRTRLWKVLTWLGSYMTALCAHQVILVSDNDLRQTHMPGVISKSSVIHTAADDFPRLSREAARSALYSEEEISSHLHDLWLITNAELNHNKNHTTAIDAVAEFNSTHSTKVFYTIIGAGDSLSSLKEQVDLRGQNEYVHFKGYQANARQYLMAFDIFLLPSKKEGLPYALLEAGVVGLPVIASNVGGIPEVIEGQVSGMLIHPENHVTITDALDYLLNNPDERNTFALNLQDKIRSHFAQSQMIEKTKDVYAR